MKQLDDEDMEPDEELTWNWGDYVSTRVAEMGLLPQFHGIDVGYLVALCHRVATDLGANPPPLEREAREFLAVQGVRIR